MTNDTGTPSRCAQTAALASFRVSAVVAMKIFRKGMFYGDFARRRRVGAIELAELQPTVPEHDVETHSHDDAHFVLVLAGKYVSSAHGMPTVCASPALIYNPPGTTHRDCFRGLEGRFFTLSIPGRRLADRDLPGMRSVPMHCPNAMRSHCATHCNRRRRLRAGDRDRTRSAARQSAAAAADANATMAPHGWRAPATGCATTVRTRRASTNSRDSPACIRSRSHARSVVATGARRANTCANAGWSAPPHCCVIASVRCSISQPLAGFSDQSHFSRAFRQRFGCTPTDYRRLR